MYHKWSRSGRLDLFLFFRKKKTRLKRQWLGKEKKKRLDVYTVEGQKNAVPIEQVRQKDRK